MNTDGLNQILAHCKLIIEYQVVPDFHEDIDRIQTAARTAQDLFAQWPKVNHSDSDVFKSRLRHDIRNCCNQIMGYSEMLAEDAEDMNIPDVVEALQAMFHCSTAVLAQLNETKAPHPAANGVAEAVILPDHPEITANSARTFLTGTILVVDDEADNRTLLKRWLEQLGHNTIMAENGLEALDIVSENSVDLVLLDVMMPEMDGYSLLSRLMADERYRDIPVIMISALGEMDSVVHCIELGAEDFLPKPFNSTLLKARINACLEKKRLKDEARNHLKRLEKDLNAARLLQRSMLPQSFPPRSETYDIDIHGIMEPARHVSGDLYDAFLLNDETLCIVLGDVSDKGAAAALFMARTMGLIRFSASANKDLTWGEQSASSIVSTVNKALEDGNTELMFVTLFLGLVNVATGEMKFCSAGHEPPLLACPDRPIKVLSTKPNMPLGMLAEAAHDEHIHHFSGSETMVLYTDGVTEAKNLDDDMYTDDRLISYVGGAALDTCQIVVDTLVDDVKNFAAGAPQSDDITVMAVRWQAPDRR